MFSLGTVADGKAIAPAHSKDLALHQALKTVGTLPKRRSRP